jgi:hypothetical protein
MDAYISSGSSGVDVDIIAMENKQMSMEATEVPSTTLMVPVTKAKGSIEIDTGMLPEHVYREIIIKAARHDNWHDQLTKEAYPGQISQVRPWKAEETLQNMYDGKSYHGRGQV